MMKIFLGSTAVLSREAAKATSARAKQKIPTKFKYVFNIKLKQKYWHTDASLEWVTQADIEEHFRVFFSSAKQAK